MKRAKRVIEGKTKTMTRKRTTEEKTGKTRVKRKTTTRKRPQSLGEIMDSVLKEMDVETLQKFKEDFIKRMVNASYIVDPENIQRFLQELEEKIQTVITPEKLEFEDENFRVNPNGWKKVTSLNGIAVLQSPEKDA